MFLAVMSSKYGTDHKFCKTLGDAQQVCDEHFRFLSKKDKNVDRNTYELGPSDSFVIYEINELKNIEDLISYLNTLFNKVFVNPQFLKVVEKRDDE